LDEGLAASNDATFVELIFLHPRAPVDRRHGPLTVVPPLQVSPDVIKMAIMSYPNGSAAGPDGLRPQHLKDLMLEVADDNHLLVAVTDLVNLFLQGKTNSNSGSRNFI